MNSHIYKGATASDNSQSANLYIDTLKWLVLIHGVLGGCLVIHIARIYHEVTNSWGLTLGRFNEALLQPEIPARVGSPQSHRAPGQTSVYLVRKTFW